MPEGIKLKLAFHMIEAIAEVKSVGSGASTAVILFSNCSQHFLCFFDIFRRNRLLVIELLDLVFLRRKNRLDGQQWVEADGQT